MMPDETEKTTGDQLRQTRDKVVDQAKTALHRAGDRLREEAEPRISGAADRLNREASRAADYLRENDSKAIARDVQDLTRQRPGLALAGAFLLGLVVARVLGRRD
jgi:ElaB/YqjD/DUF883 family membrane-anchored ribosome-binding protein